MVPARVPYGIRKVHARVLAIPWPKTHREPRARACMWPCTSHEGDFVHVRTSQVPQTRTAPQVLRSRDHPYVSCDLRICFVCYWSPLRPNSFGNRLVRHRCCPGSIPVINTWQSSDRLPKVIDIPQVLQEFRAFEFFAIEEK